MELTFNHYLGALSALGSAFFWAVAAILFGRIGQQMKARAMNLAKGLIALLCLLLFILPSSALLIAPTTFWMLALSGFLGICIGDTLYLLCIQRLGARITLLIATLIPVVTAVMAFVFFQEFMGVSAYLCLLLTVASVTYVLWSKVAKEKSNVVWLSGLLIGVLFVLTESTGIMLTKWAVFDIDSMYATFIRQFWGVVGLTVWGLLAKDLIIGFEPLKNNPKLQKTLFTAAICGAFLGTWLSVLALKLTYASVAVALNSTSPIFVIPIAILVFKEKVSKSSIVGSLFAVFGVVLYFLQVPNL